MSSGMHPQAPGPKRSGNRIRRGPMMALAVLAASLLLVAFWVKQNLYASKITPVHLVGSEQAMLDAKLSRLEDRPIPPRTKPMHPGTGLVPEPYSEEGARREISLTERELNALVATHPGAAERVAIDLSDDLISVILVLPVDDEVPVLGGKTLKFHLGLTVRQERDRPYIALKGVSLGGIPLPNAWLGYLKHVNLVEEFGTEDGFWKIFSAGVRTIRVARGRMWIALKK